MYFIPVIQIVLGLAGISIAGYIYYEKTKKKPMVCPLNGKCDVVTGSKYSKFMGVPVEIGGMLYYATIIGGYGIYFFLYGAAWDQLSLGLQIISGIGFIFSAYLTYVQGVILKDWCTWCIGSAIITTIIFTLSFWA